MRTRIKVLLAVLVLTLVSASVYASGEWAALFPNMTPITGQAAADDADHAMIIAYRGTGGQTTATTTVEVDANSINLLVTAVAATGIICPAGGTAGEINITDAACDTLGEICDHINASASGYKCVIVDGLRTDFAYSTDKKILTAAAAPGDTLAGVSVHWDTSTNLQSTVLVAPPIAKTFDYYWKGGQFVPEPFAGITSYVTNFNSTASTCTAAGLQRVYGSTLKIGRSGAGSETVNTWFSKTGSTTTTILDNTPPFPGIFGLPGERLLFRRTCATAYVNAGMYSGGFQTLAQ